MRVLKQSVSDFINKCKDKSCLTFEKVHARVLIFAFIFLFILSSMPIEHYFVNAISSELENRNCITYPNAENRNIDQVFKVSGWNGSRAAMMTARPHTYIVPGAASGASAAGDMGSIESTKKIDILNNDFSITYSMTHNIASGGLDHGTAFVIYNDDNHSSETHRNQNASALGLYKMLMSGAGLAPRNSLAVEFDQYNWTGTTSDKGRLDRLPIGINQNGPHIAITDPEKTNYDTVNKDNPLPHNALSAVSGDRFNDGQWGTAKVEWFLINPGNTDAYSDNVYRFQYSYWYSHHMKGDGTYWQDSTEDPVTGRIPDLTGHMDFTFSQMAEKFGYTQSDTVMPVTMAITSSTDSLVNHGTWFRFPATHPYTINYYLEDADGNLTTDKVPGITPNPKRGEAAEGSIRVKPPSVTNYIFDETKSDPLEPIITELGDNVFNYYYKEKMLDYSIEYYKDGNLLERNTNNVPASSPTVASISTSNMPAGYGVSGYEFPAGTPAAPPTATAPYRITETDNVIKVYYKKNIIENPTDAVKNDKDYCIVNFNANDIKDNTSNEVIRGRLSSKKTTALQGQEVITYAVLRNVKWNDFASEYVAPTVKPHEPYWFNQIGANQWKTSRDGSGSSLPNNSLIDNLDAIVGVGNREITYYAQYNENTPAGILLRRKAPFSLAVTALILSEVVLALVIGKKLFVRSHGR